MNKDDKMGESKQNKTGPDSNPENKFKKDSNPATADSINDIIKSPVESVKAKSGEPLHEKGTNVDYTEEE